ncbi:hypothetical protein AAHC03_01710 [Spirometra sp. Aus1]
METTALKVEFVVVRVVVGGPLWNIPYPGSAVLCVCVRAILLDLSRRSSPLAMTDDQTLGDVNPEERCRLLSEENKKLSIDIASLQLSNRSLVNQNRDEKKKVMDCRLQISDLESRLKTLESTKTELADCQTQAERLRASLDATESKLASTERRATEAESLIRVKDSIIEKQRNFSKELEGQVKTLSEETETLKSKCGNLEMSLKEALDRAEECDNLRELLTAKTKLLDELSESSDGIGENGLAAANEFFKAQEAKMTEQINDLKRTRSELENNLASLASEKALLEEKTLRQETELNDLRGKCSSLEAKVREGGHGERRSKNDATNARLIGPSLPPWIMEEKKTDPSDLEKLANADPETLRSRVLELESQVHELNQLLTYREDVILRIHEEISKKASRLEAAEVERSSLSAQVSILKRELACLRDDAPRRRGGYPPEIEIEIERLRGKRDREYQRRKRAETEMDELDQENNELKAKIKTLEEQLANIPPPKPPAPQGDPTDKSRIAELQAALSQLRMDNEAKRSELFDLRSRFDEKSAQLDKLAAEMKTKERTVTDLSTELSSKISQLEYANKELESVRCRVVRGGSETERWQTDINSVRTTNRFLSAQANELRLKLAGSEKRVEDLQKQILSKLQNGESAANSEKVPLENHPLACPACGEEIRNGISFADNNHNDPQLLKDLKSKEEQCKALEQRLTEAANKGIDLERKVSEQEDLVSSLKSQLSTASKDLADASAHIERMKTIEADYSGLQELYANLQTEVENLRDSADKNSKATSEFEDQRVAEANNRIKQLLENLRREQEASSNFSERCSSLTTQISSLETKLEETRAKLEDSKSENRRTDIGQIAVTVSPPAKRARRTRNSTAAQNASSECAMCTELKLQLQNVESDLVEANHLRSSSVSELNELREKLSKAGAEACDLRREINSLQSDLTNSSDRLLTMKCAVTNFIGDVDSGNCICSGDTSTVDRLRLATTASA